MLTAVCIGTNNLVAASNFYNNVLQSIGMVELYSDDVEIGYGLPGQMPCFWVLTPYNKEPASYGNGTQVIFQAKEQTGVDRFYELVIAAGGTDEGAPGPRAYAPGYYGAYCRDLDGNKLHIFYLPAHTG